MRALRLFAVLAVLAFGFSAAAEPPAGTKNFNAPAGVPNYFSNEAGAPIAQRGVIHHVAPEPAYAAEPARVPTRIAAAHRRSGRHHAAAHRKHRGTKFASAKHKRRATRVASRKAKVARTASARSGSERRVAAHASTHIQAKAKAKATKTATRTHPPTKARQTTHHAG